ncbi:MAG: peptidase T [Spirochaetales bacterium]|nr:peptidase T [Spirochaetales bacterium]
MNSFYDPAHLAASWRGGLLTRFLRYVRIDTTSDRHNQGHPSTPGQWDLLRLLVDELAELGVEDCTLNSEGYLIARIPPSEGASADYIGLMAHVDTASDCPGSGVQPKIHEDYDGGVLHLSNEVCLDPAEYPYLNTCTGHTIITSDGSTLLGADDKAGIAIIMTFVENLLKNPQIPRCGIEIIFTPDEETGTGMDRFPADQLKSTCCYTLDGDDLGSIEGECFHAYKAVARFWGRVIHLGKARGQLANAVTMVSQFVAMLPRNESPEASDDRYGYYCPLEMKAGLATAELEIYLRDFEQAEIDRRISYLKTLAQTVEGMFPGGRVELQWERQYMNMRDRLEESPLVMAHLEQAIIRAGIRPVHKSIRGGTDGSRLTEMGIPTPNVFTGGQNFHSTSEFASLDIMGKAVEVLLHLVQLWAEM